MIVGLDSEVTITELHMFPGKVEGTMELNFTYKLEVYGRLDQSFATDLNAAIAHKLETIFIEEIPC